MRRLRWIPLAVGGALVLGGTTFPSQAEVLRPAPGGRPESARITLITGDRVRVTSTPGRPERVVFEPAATSRSDAAVITYAGGHTYVVPSAAADGVASGRFDRTLFDVTTLLAEQRDDRRSATIPVIVRYSGATAVAVGRARQAKLPGAGGDRVLASLGARAAKISKSSTGAFWQSVGGARAIERVSLDRKVTVKLDGSVPQVGAPAAWQRGLTGKGVKVAILDTGVDPAHPDLAGRIVGSANFTGAADAIDHHGHGTHVAGIAAGSGAASTGSYRGVAPEATVLSGKVLDDTGSGESSGIIAGMEWAAAQGATVINMSLGSGSGSDGTDDLSQAVDRISRATGVLMVVAAGNCPDSRPAMVSSPAAATEAVAVGNMARDGSMNDSSCRGPRMGDGNLKPEISAPGTAVVAPRAAGTTLGTPVGDHYTTLTGTSMAAPHVAGVAALIAQSHPDWKWDRLKARLMSTADPQPGARVDEQGAGRVDADQATGGDAAASILVDTGELELGVLRWPHPASDPVTREVTYTNPTEEPMSLRLTAVLEPAAATPKLSVERLDLPAGRSATVTVTVDRASAGAGYHSGRIIATPVASTDGPDPIVTTVGWCAEPEMYDLTVTGVAHDGRPAEGGLVVSRLDGPHVDLGPFGPGLSNGTAKVRLPAGGYEVTTALRTDATDTGPEQWDLVTSGEIDLSKDATVLLDARRSRPVRLGVHDRPGLGVRHRSMTYLRTNTAGEYTGGVLVESTGPARVFRAVPSAKAVTGSRDFMAQARLEIPPYRAQVRGGDAFTVLDYEFGPRFTGSKDLPLFDAGFGSADELRGVRGKLALIRSPGGDSDRTVGLVEAAQAAGAAAAVLYNPDRPGDGGVHEYWGRVDDGSAIPAMRTSRATARGLLESLRDGSVVVRITGQAASPFVYDLAQAWAGQVPTVPSRMLHTGELARVDETFGAHRPGARLQEGRMARSPSGTWAGGWLLPIFTSPAHRTSYLQTGGTAWDSVLLTDRNEVFLSDPQVHVEGGRSRVRWLAPVQLSGLPATEGQQSMIRRIEGGLQFLVSPFQHQREAASVFGNPDSELVVERNGERIATAAETGLWVEVPAAAADFRVALDTRREGEDWRYSTRVTSVWTFRSAGGADDVMPVVFADLDLPQADSLSRVPAGKPVTITLGLRHQAGSGSTSPFTAARLELSYDGATWSDLPLTKDAEGRYHTTLIHPAARAGSSPWLRLSAADAAGNKVEHQVTRAYGLR